MMIKLEYFVIFMKMKRRAKNLAYHILIVSIIIFLCLTASRLSSKIGIPTLIFFIGLGMLFGSEGIGGIPFDNYESANDLCSLALIYIIFYGGFGVSWKMAKPIAAKAGMLSTVGVALTALLTGGFCYFVLKMDFLEGLLLGSVLGCTDAAAVFYILKAKKLNLKNGLASLLEIESGSNDPSANILTIILIQILSGKMQGSVAELLIMQFVVGILAGALMGLLASYILRTFANMNEGLGTIFIVAIALFAYSTSQLLGGNGYLSVYIAGIILGNTRIPNKATLVHFFDGVTSLFQMLVFFLLGLLVFPTEVISYLGVAVLVALFLTFVARPAAVAILLTPFKVPFKQQLLVSWAGLRGASSIVFAIVVTVSGVFQENRIFNIVFCVALLSIGIQGALLSLVARKLDLIDDESPVSMTFSDYQNDADVQLVNILISKNHPWIGKRISEITFPHHALAVYIQRKSDRIIPKGDTILEAQDMIVLSSDYKEEHSDLEIQELPIGKNHEWIGKTIAQCHIPKDMIFIMVKRKEENIIPSGTTVIRQNDVLLSCKLKSTE